MPKKKNILRVGLFNAGFLGTSHDDFICAGQKYGFNVLAINETRLRPNEEGRAPTLPGYLLRHAPLPSSVRGGRGGGVGFYVRRGLNARTYTELIYPRFKSVEQIWLAVSIARKRIVIGTAYRPLWLVIDLFLDTITNSFTFLGNWDHYILLGDFNDNMLNTNEFKTKKILEFQPLYYIRLQLYLWLKFFVAFQIKSDLLKKSSSVF